MKKWIQEELKSIREMERKTLRKYSVVFVVFNIFLVAAIGFTFFQYVKDNTDELYQVTLKELETDSAQISGLVEHYLGQQEELVDGVAAYVEKAGLKEEEIQLYLETMKIKRGRRAVIDAETCQGYEIKADGFNKNITEEVNYKDNTAIAGICAAAEMGTEENALSLTDIFDSDTLQKTSDIAIYKPILVEGKLHVFLYIMSISEITEELLESQPMENKEGILINAKGQVLSSEAMLPAELRHSVGTIDNFREYVEKTAGKEESRKIWKLVEENSDGNFMIVDKEGTKWVYGYSHVSKTSGWVYLYLQQHQELGMSVKAWRAMIELAALIALICGLDIGIIFWQNRRLKRNLVELVAANEAKSSFISNVSHEIRTPINAILGMDEMIIRESTEEDIVHYAADIRSAGKTLLGIINDILDFSKLGSGKMEIIPADYEIASVVNDLLNMVESRAKAKNLEIKMDIAPEIPHLLYGDELRIKQVILNLLTNAVKYTEKGRVTLTMRHRKLDEERISLYVAVEDTGIGLRPEDRDKLCRPFERMDEKRNRTIEGTGLGMSIVASLLMQMHSELKVESVYGEGSKFSFFLEQKVEDWEGMGDLERIYQDAKKHEKETAVLHASKAIVLVVDDTQVNLTVAAGLLKRTGMTVETAGSGAECLKKVMEKKYHAILLDHRMPEMDGVETLHHLKEMDSPNKETPVIALTANAVSGAYEYYIEEGFDDFLSKPVNGGRLERMLLKYLPEEVLDREETEENCQEDAAVELSEKGIPELLGFLEINQPAGLSACGTRELYEQVLEDFAAVAESRIREIREFYDKGDIRNYTVKVHALKSSARLIGAMELSEEAAYLEQCGDSGEIEEIASKTEALLTNYADLGIKLREALKKEGKPEEAEIDEGKLTEALLAIREFNEAFDFDSVDAVIKSISVYEIPEKAKGVWRQLTEAVLDVDQERIRKLIDGYVGGADHE